MSRWSMSCPANRKVMMLRVRLRMEGMSMPSSAERVSARAAEGWGRHRRWQRGAAMLMAWRSLAASEPTALHTNQVGCLASPTFKQRGLVFKRSIRRAAL